LGLALLSSVLSDPGPALDTFSHPSRLDDEANAYERVPNERYALGPRREVRDETNDRKDYQADTYPYDRDEQYTCPGANDVGPRWCRPA
jgi:hypothetical protein